RNHGSPRRVKFSGQDANAAIVRVGIHGHYATPIGEPLRRPVTAVPSGIIRAYLREDEHRGTGCPGRGNPHGAGRDGHHGKDRHSRQEPSLRALHRAGSRMVRTCLGARSSTICTTPEGQTTSIRSTLSLAPSPTWSLGSLVDREGVALVRWVMGERSPAASV